MNAFTKSTTPCPLCGEMILTTATDYGYDAWCPCSPLISFAYTAAMAVEAVAERLEAAKPELAAAAKEMGGQ
jgi:hypothetical protein